jgi:hypothetical protein
MSPEETVPVASRDWPLRPWLAGGLLALCGLAVWLLTKNTEASPGRMAGAAFFVFGGVSAAFTLDRDEWLPGALFSALAGLVMAGLAFHALDVGGHVAGEEFGFAAGVFALLLALPLFQAGFHRTRFATPYRDIHFHVWTDAVCGAGALAFTGLSWIVLAILSELFHLLRIELLRDLMQEGWFGWMYSGAAFGAALGTLRNQIRVIGTLRHVVMLVLSLLAVPTALALVLFLGAMLVSGPDVLWEATRSATPVLLACAAGAFVLANAIVREDDDEMSRNPAMRFAALALATVILPLTVFAAVSMGTRIDQRGLSPERLWGLIAIAVACAYGLAAFVAVLRGRMARWPQYLRRANLNLAAGISVLALLLALPIVDFGAISARQQVARLDGGKVSPARFDYHALRWQFGDAGREALADLARRGGEVGKLAKEAQAETEPYPPVPMPDREERTFDNRVVDPALRARVDRYWQQNPYVCGSPCIAVDGGAQADGALRAVFVGPDGITVREFDPKSADAIGQMPEPAPAAAVREDSKVEVRPWQGRRVFIDGKPVGPPLE